MEEHLWEVAYEWACQRARAEGNIDINKDYEIIKTWQEEYYNWLIDRVKERS